MIRLAHSGDAELVHALVHEAYRHWLNRTGRVPGPLRDDYVQRIAARQLWVLVAHATIVGVMVLIEQAEFLLIENVAVSPGEQGNGYGRALITFAEQIARERGTPELRLCTNVLMSENVALYQHLGFTEVGRINGTGYERICLGKDVHNAE